MIELAPATDISYASSHAGFRHVRQCDKRQTLICIHEALSKFKEKLQSRIKSRGSWWTPPLSFQMISTFLQRLCETSGYFPLSHVFILHPPTPSSGQRSVNQRVGCVVSHGDNDPELAPVLKGTQQLLGISGCSCRLCFKIVWGLATSYQSYCQFAGESVPS